VKLLDPNARELLLLFCDPRSPDIVYVSRRRWLSGIILASHMLDRVPGSNLSAETYSSEYHHGGISQEGFVQGLVSPPVTGRYIGSVRIIS
jgi:hypothetical protein